MIKNIYQELGFKAGTNYLYNERQVAAARDLFNAMPLKNLGCRPLILEKAVFEETLAISTAEDSSLTEKQARQIYVSEEQAARILKYKNNQKLAVREKYEQLEFENIKAVENNIRPISFAELKLELILGLHHDLTIGLDDYHREMGVSSYHPGVLRQSDRVKVGKIRSYIPPQPTKIRTLLKALLQYFASKKQVALADILEFHILFYAIHPFQNGNKRVVRILESMLLNHYGYSADRLLSLSVYYLEKKEDMNFFLLTSLNKRDLTPFVNFALRGYFEAGIYMFIEILSANMVQVYKDISFFIETHINAMKTTNYLKAARVIALLKGVFTHGEFINKMKDQKCSLGISQNIIKYFLEEGLVNKKDNIYYVGKSLEFRLYLNKLSHTYIENGLPIPEDFNTLNIDFNTLLKLN